MTDEEQAQLEAESVRPPADDLMPMGDAAPPPPSPVAPNPAMAFDSPEYGPPAPDPTDAIAAKLPPAPGGIPTRDGGAEWPPAVPGQAPGNVGPPGSPIPQAPESAPGTTADVKDAMGKEKDAREEALKAQQDQLEAGQDIAGAKDEAATARAQAAAESVKHAEAIQQQYDKADALAQQQIQQTQAALKNFKFKDYWADKSSAQRVLSSLGVAMGALGAGLTKTPNYALQILDKEMDRDHQQQVEHLNQLSDQAVMAHTGLQDSRAARTKAMADLTLADAGKDKLIASQLEEAAARSNDQNYKNVVTAQVAKLREESQGKEVDAAKQLRTMNLADQHAALEAEHLKAQDEYLKQHGEYFEKGGAKGRHGTGGGAGNGAALAAFTAAATDGHTSAADLAKLGTAAHLKPNQINAEVERIRRTNTAGDSGVLPKGGAAAGGVDDKLVVRDEKGVPVMLASTARAVPELQKQLRTLPRAIKQLETLRDADKWTSTGPEFHDAVLAVAATTSAGSTDSNVAHEKGTLTNALGMPDRDAINTKIAQLKEQAEDIKRQGAPLPDGYAERKTNPGGGGPGGKPFDTTPRDPAKMDRARKAITSKSATPDQKANAAAYLKALGESP